IVKWLSPPAIANQQVGLYRAALTISQLLYQLLIPLALVIFPHLSHLGHDPDPERARNLVRDALRYLALSVLPGAALLSVMALAVGLPLAIRRFGDIIPWASVARGAALAVLLALVASRFPASGWLVPAKGLALAVAAVLLLIASGELKLPGRMRGIPETA